MQVRAIKTNEVFPPPVSARSSLAKKLTGYLDVVKKIREGTIPENGVVLQLDDKDAKTVGIEMSKLGSRIVARLKNELKKCYGLDGGAKGRNLQIYQVSNQVIVRKLTDKDEAGFLYSPQGQEAYRESRSAA